MIPIERLQYTPVRTIEADLRQQQHDQRVQGEHVAGFGALPPEIGLGNVFAGGLAGFFGIRRTRQP